MEQRLFRVGITVLAVLSCIPSAHAENRKRSVLRITDGKEISPGKLPVSLGGDGCTGTLIAPTYVLSAAHCAAELAKKPFVIIAGEKISVQKIIPALNIPPDYRPANDDSITEDIPLIRRVLATLPKNVVIAPYPDIALILLARPAKTKPARLLNKPVRKGEKVMLVGYGMTAFKKNDNGTLRYGYAKVD